MSPPLLDRTHRVGIPRIQRAVSLLRLIKAERSLLEMRIKGQNIALWLFSSIIHKILFFIVSEAHAGRAVYPLI